MKRVSANNKSAFYLAYQLCCVPGISKSYGLLKLQDFAQLMVENAMETLLTQSTKVRAPLNVVCCQAIVQLTFSRKQLIHLHNSQLPFAWIL